MVKELVDKNLKVVGVVLKRDKRITNTDIKLMNQYVDKVYWSLNKILTGLWRNGSASGWHNLSFAKRNVGERKGSKHREAPGSKAPFSLEREKPARKRELFRGCMKVPAGPLAPFFKKETCTKEI